MYFTELAATVAFPPPQAEVRLTRLSQVTVVLGRNGSGKSLLLRALHQADRAGRHYVSPERGGNFTYRSNLLETQLDASQRAARRTGNFAGEFRDEVLSRVQALLMKVASVAIRGGPSPVDGAWLEAAMTRLLPEFSFRITGENPPYELTRREGGQKVANAGALSSGEAELLGVALDVLTAAAMWEADGTAQRLLLVDEPDTHLHPDLQHSLAAFLVEVAEKFELQLLVAIHSTTLLAALGHHGGDRTSVAYLVPGAAETRAQPFSDSLRELSACLGGHALMGPLFGAPLLLVEGDDEFKIWGQVPRHHVVRAAVIPCGSNGEVKSYQATLEQMLRALRSPGLRPAGYALLDGDTPLPEANPDRPQDHVRFLRLACRAAENLYLADEVLADIGTDWAAAKALIAKKAPEYGKKQPLLAACVARDRKTDNFKDFVAEVADIVDPKRLPWTLRVAKVVGRKRPTGQLAEFLGEAVLAALWPPAT